MRNRIAYVVVAFIALLGCTPTEHAQWLDWHAQDPVAAEAFAVELSQQPRASSTSVWDAVAQCESGQDWGYNGRSGYDGGLQFLPAVWRNYDGPTEFAWQASRAQQITVAERILDDVGWQAWPTCSRKLGLR